MRCILSGTLVLCLGLAGCSSYGSRPFTNHANLEMYDPPRRARTRPSTSHVEGSHPLSGSARFDSASETVGSASPVVSGESAAARRERMIREDAEREERLAAHLRNVIRICRGC
jgi:hypothetical protein